MNTNTRRERTRRSLVLPVDRTRQEWQSDHQGRTQSMDVTPRTSHDDDDFIFHDDRRARRPWQGLAADGPPTLLDGPKNLDGWLTSVWIAPIDDDRARSAQRPHGPSCKMHFRTVDPIPPIPQFRCV